MQRHLVYCFVLSFNKLYRILNLQDDVKLSHGLFGRTIMAIQIVIIVLEGWLLVVPDTIPTTHELAGLTPCELLKRALYYLLVIRISRLCFYITLNYQVYCLYHT